MKGSVVIKIIEVVRKREEGKGWARHRARRTNGDDDEYGRQFGQFAGTTLLHQHDLLVGGQLIEVGDAALHPECGLDLDLAVGQYQRWQPNGNQLEEGVPVHVEGEALGDGMVAEIAHCDKDVDVLARLELVRACAPLFEAEVDIRHLNDLHIEVVAVGLVEARLRLLLLGGNRWAASRLNR
jgi:hypothetical protein